MGTPKGLGIWYLAASCDNHSIQVPVNKAKKRGGGKTPRVKTPMEGALHGGGAWGQNAVGSRACRRRAGQLRRVNCPVATNQALHSRFGPYFCFRRRRGWPDQFRLTHRARVLTDSSLAWGASRDICGGEGLFKCGLCLPQAERGRVRGEERFCAPSQSGCCTTLLGQIALSVVINSVSPASHQSDALP